MIVVFAKVVGIFKNKAEGSIPPESPNSKIEPVFGVTVVGHIRVALDLYGERAAPGDRGRVEVTPGEAAINDDVVVEVEVVSVGVPDCLFRLVAATFLHTQ